MGSGEWVGSSMSYVRPSASGGQDAWSAEAAARGGRGSQRIVQAGEMDASSVVADLLGVARGATVIVRRRIMYLDDQPTELTDTYYPLHVAAGTPLCGTAKIRGGAVALLAELGYVGRRVREDVGARMPDREERDVLQLEPHQPALTLARVTFDADERPIQADLMVMPAHRQRLRYELAIG
ncbi:GntR family transcriptional regulator [Streptantibioticus ferralitis]|uniref:UTRA domain-containing protein n=1 Tax=Streptantibioticus ferralitis TaxID=236510 RepID=A0ABT5YRL8_9ACTN|nr:UTRA domain-containing protein [Streptantibioticus ferralitis]MDF2254241.1 UTRA domain-containing protein [Streptantibioticus ferralitis]